MGDLLGVSFSRVPFELQVPLGLAVVAVVLGYVDLNVAFGSWEPLDGGGGGVLDCSNVRTTKKLC